MKRLFSLMLTMTLCVTAWAQKGVSVEVRLVDSETGEAVGFATVSLTLSGSDKPYKYVMSDEEGRAEITAVEPGTYVLRTELMGYKGLQTEIKVERKSLNLGTLKMSGDAEVLDAASVSAPGNPVVFKQDTVEYNASSFKSSDNDMLEELLKKLPGVEVADDGTVTVNGEAVKKITIGGKTFFLDDPAIATKNIPAKIIDKLQVVEQKTERAQFTGIDDGVRETVIDLKIKPGMFGGWFGNLTGGGGHDVPGKDAYSDGTKWTDEGWRYQGAGMVGRFDENTQLSIIANGNNTNNRGFSDLSSTIMNRMRSSMGGSSNVSGSGITASRLGGVNGAMNLCDGDMDLSGSYLYSGSNSTSQSQSTKITYLDNGSDMVYDKDYSGSSGSQGHTLGITLEHKFSEKSSIRFKPQFRINSSDYHNYSDFTTVTEQDDGSDAVLSNSGFNENAGSSSSWGASGSLFYRQRLNKPGRTVSFTFSYGFSGSESEGFTQSYTDNDPEGEGDVTIVNRRVERSGSYSSVSAGMVYTEPIVENLNLQVNYSYSWNRNSSDKISYDSPTDSLSDGHIVYNPVGETFSEDYSSSIVSSNQRHNAGLTLMYHKDKLTVNAGATVRPNISDNETDGKTYSNTVTNWAPQFSFRYNARSDDSVNSYVRLNYSGTPTQPGTSQLMPVTSNSDPLNVSFGNPYLKTYFTHSVSGQYSYSNKKTFTSFRANMNGRIVQNPIGNAKWYDTDGAQYVIPVNGPQTGSADLNLMCNSPFTPSSKFSVYTNVYCRFTESHSYVGKTDEGQGDELIARYYDTDTGIFDYDTFQEDFFDSGHSSEDKFTDYFTDTRTSSVSTTTRLRFTYRDDNVEIMLGGQTRIYKSWYSLSTTPRNVMWNNMVDASVNCTLPAGISLVVTGNYKWYDGYTTPMDDNIVVNAVLSKLLFNDKITLSAKVYDLLNQSQSMWETDTSNYHSEGTSNTLGRYVILSLTFRFGNFNAIK